MTPELYAAHAQLEETHWWFAGRRQVIRSVMQRWVSPRQKRTILDVGCGTGGMFPLLREFGTVEGAEPSEEARRFLAERAETFTVHPCSLPDGLPPGAWHVLAAFDVIEHVEHPVAALVAMRERSAPDGQLVVTVPAFPFLWSRHDELNQHYRRYRRHSLTAHLELAGWRPIHISYFNSALFPAVAGTRLAQRVLRRQDTQEADLKPVPRLLNAGLTRLFSAEAPLAARVSIPAGVSLIAVADRAR